MVTNVKIPKRIGAIKVSKKVRKKVKKAIKSAASPFVRDFATAAMAAAGRARRDGDGASEREERVMCGRTNIHIEGSKVAEVFRAAAVDGLRRFLEGLEEGLRKAQNEQTVDADGPQPKAKPKPKPKPKTKAAAKPKARAKPKAAKAARKPSASGRPPAPVAAAG